MSVYVTCYLHIKGMSNEMYKECAFLPGFEERIYGICGLVGLYFVTINQTSIHVSAKCENKDRAVRNTHNHNERLLGDTHCSSDERGDADLLREARLPRLLIVLEAH